MGFLTAWMRGRAETRSAFYRDQEQLTDAQRQGLQRDGAVRSILNNSNVPWN
ncbi:MAG TPA: hypothetical protein VFH51_16325 [Myxococcota bacterium]|nr:hypothetical protein [Myxococcota bacterium]